MSPKIFKNEQNLKNSLLQRASIWQNVKQFEFRTPTDGAKTADKYQGGLELLVDWFYIFFIKSVHDTW